ncbi:unnamed protein product [Caenorhabditis brenneri]
MEHTRIKVTTIDYYHRDQALKLSCGVLPKQLNENRKFFQDTNFVLSPVNLNIEEYLRHKPSQLTSYSPDFITNQRLLECIASSDYEQISVQVVNIDGVIYMLKSSEDADWNPNYDMVFEHFMTRCDENEEILEDGGVRKAVMMAAIPTGGNWDQEPIKVLYSAKIDAIDASMQHYELKVSYEGTNTNFWKNDSCHCYWKSIFSKSETLIIGSRTGRYPNDFKTRPPYLIPEYSLYELKSLAVQDLPLEAAKSAMNPKKPLKKHERRKTYWTIRQCEENLRNFLYLAQASVQVQGDCVISKMRIGDKWAVTKLDKRVSQFVKNRFSLKNGNRERGVLRSKSDVGVKETRSRLTNHRHTLPAMPDSGDEESGPREVLNPMYLWRKEELKKTTSTPPLNNGYEMPRSLKWSLFRGSLSPPPRPTLSTSVQTDDPGPTSPSSKSILKSPTTCGSRSKSVSFSELVEGELESSEDLEPTDPGSLGANSAAPEFISVMKTENSVAENQPTSSRCALQTQPKSKIVFNSPYDEKQTNRLKLTNQTALKIGFEVRIKSAKDQPRIHLSPESGSMDPGESINVIVTCEEFNFDEREVEKDRIIIEWILVPDGEEFKLEMLEGDGDFHRKTLIIEYNY